MLRNSKVLSGVAVAALLAAGGCGGSDSASPTSSSAGGGRGGPGGGQGGPGGGMGGQTFTAVNLNTDGDSPGGANTAEVVTAANAFLATLDDTLKAKINLAFTDNQSRQTWSNFPASTVARKGVALKDLSETQRAAALAMMKVALSADGYQQVLNIQKADDYLNGLGGQGADGFGNLVDYYVAVYGTPSATDPFMVQFGGHHLARNLTYNGTKVSQTPQFVGSEPTSFESGGQTVAPVKDESTAMFAMIASLGDSEKAAAKLTSGTYDDLMMGPTHDDGQFPASEGLAVSTLTDAQKKLVLAAIAPYVDDLADDAAAKLLAKYTSELDSTKIAWANNTGPDDESSYLRIDGPSVWIEFINTRSMSTPNIHYHSVYRDKTDDYGSTKPS
ncbi:DUF3500 domain-containing protein [Actinoplanes sp. HUAS TT8]|uniref:DUF3500 domain-containing protein n=1 Tax=Actinoplanes sp. HUAS TT8 TaxID=3447453 RepID=UPI003F523A59